MDCCGLDFGVADDRVDSCPPLQNAATRREQNALCAEIRQLRSELHGTSDTRRVDRCGGFCVHGDWMGHGGGTSLWFFWRGPRLPGGAAFHPCSHNFRRQPSGRDAGHPYLTAKGLLFFGPIERTRLFWL